MGRYKLAYYKAKKGNYIDKFIGWQTDGEYSHVEIVDTYTNLRYSSSNRNGGVSRQEWKGAGDKWDLQNICVPANSNEKLNELYELTKHCKYDHLGILGFGIPLQDAQDKFFCSEWCSKTLFYLGYYELMTHNFARISPVKLHKLVEAINKEIECGVQ